MKTIGFFVSSNGLGHLERVQRVVNFLNSDEFEITIYCTKWQYDFLSKSHPNLSCNYIFVESNNLKWSDITKTNKFDFNEYKSYIEKYKDEINKFDLFISDNLVYFLELRSDTILLSSFFWFDVFEDYFGKNDLTDYEKKLVNDYNPKIITNKFLEIGSVKNYKNKIQYAWGLPKNKKNNLPKKFVLKKLVFIEPSLNYLDYKKEMNLIKSQTHLDVSNDINDISNSLFLIRPGGGLTTYCVSNNIPFISIVSKNDSIEIRQITENLYNEGLTLIHYIGNEFDFKSMYHYVNKFDLTKNMEFNSYKKISEYIKNLL